MLVSSIYSLSLLITPLRPLTLPLINLSLSLQLNLTKSPHVELEQYVLHIDKATGEVLFCKGYAAWSRTNPDPARRVTEALLSCRQGAAVVYVRVGKRKSDEDIINSMLERSLFQMVKPEDYLELDAFSSDSQSDQGELVESLVPKYSPQRLSQAGLARGISTASSGHKKSYLAALDNISPDLRVLKDMASAISWSGGDASKLTSKVSYVLLGTPYERGRTLENKEVSRSYQQWHCENGHIFERSLHEEVDITTEEDVELGDGKLLDITFTTPGPPGGSETGTETETETETEKKKGKKEEKAGSRLQLVPNLTRGNKPMLCFSKRSFITSPLRARSDAESVAWKTRQSLGLPTYIQLCRLEYEALLSTSTFLEQWLHIRFFLVALGVGHLLTEVGRRAWYVVVWKYLRFLLLCFGYWTDDVVEMYHVHQRLQATSLVWTHPHFKDTMSTYTKEDHLQPHRTSFLQQQHLLAGTAVGTTRRWLSWISHGGKETESLARIPEMTLKHMYQDDYSAALSTIVSTRACLLQLVPGLAILSIFANLTSIAPMLVYSNELELSLPETLISHVKATATEIENEFTCAVNKIRKDELHEDDLCVSVPPTAPPASVAVIEEHNEASRVRMRRCLAQPELLVKTWVVRLRSIMLYASHSRGFTFLYQLVQFSFILGILFGLDSKESVTAFIVMTILLLFPVCVIHALSSYILIGKILAITDEDIDHFYRACWERVSWQSKQQTELERPKVEVKMTMNPLAREGAQSSSVTPTNAIGDANVTLPGLTDLYQGEEDETVVDLEGDRVTMTTNPLHDMNDA